MKAYQRRFIDFAIQHEVLSFGEFTLKSGRQSPYFFNAGKFNTGEAMAQLGYYYASAIVDHHLEFDVMFGPAYKGIPLATATAVALATEFNIDTPICFNRKEAKDHGEKGLTIGAPLQGDVLIIDDVITAGTAISEAATIIQDNNAAISSIIIALDRQERGKEDYSAIDEVKHLHRCEVVSIVSFNDLIEYLAEQTDMAQELIRMKEYQLQYQAKSWPIT